MIDILHEGHKKLEERVLTMESALTKTKKELLETKKEVAILSLFGEVGRSTKHVSHKSPRLKSRDQTIAFFFFRLTIPRFCQLLICTSLKVVMRRKRAKIQLRKAANIL